jgi:quercetin dioxygenase-like cupin family protein
VTLRAPLALRLRITKVPANRGDEPLQECVMRELVLPSIAAACVLTSGCGGASAADPGATATQSAALVTQRLAVGVLPSLHRIPKDNSPHDVIVSLLTLAPGDIVAFHYHPGPVFVVIATGTLTEDDGCGNFETHLAGTAFQEIPGHVHEVTNKGTDTVQLYVTNFPPHGQPGSIPATPDCKPNQGGDESEDD